MGFIRRMPPALAQRIAAGEDIERPAAVVKELVENSLDAGATRIVVELQEGGIRSIRVADDGVGMDSSDCVLAIERHASSKTITEADLERITTYGFRGEALASIAAVSHLIIQSRRAEDEMGTRVECVYGELRSIDSCTRTPGTTVEARGLFRTIPARLKFMGTPAAETSRVLRVLRATALARPDVHFTLTADGDTLLDATPTSDFKVRVAQLFGDRFANTLVSIQSEKGGVRVEGFVSRPEAAGRQARNTVYLLNGRPFQSPELRRVVSLAMHGRIPAGHSPEAILFITMDPTEYDVNISPDKSLVRFRVPGLVYAAVTEAVRSALAAPATVGPSHFPSPSSSVATIPTVSEERPLLLSDPTEKDSFTESLLPSATELALPLSGIGTQAPPTTSIAQLLPEEPRWLVQVARKFLVTEVDEGLLYIDQHSAHERILYEELVKRGGGEETQILLIPETMEIDDVEERLVLEDMIPSLAAAGFRVEPAGPRAFWIWEVPAWSARQSAAHAIRRAINALAEPGKRFDRGERHAVRERLLQTIACHAAVRAGEDLAEQEIRTLWAKLRTIDLGLADVHGRPGAVLVRHDEIERRLGRTVVRASL